MSTLLKLFILVFIVPSLMGCKEKLTSNYLMQHPALLKQEVDKCQSTVNKSREQAAQCEAVMYAAANVMSELDEQQRHPEQFGQRVLDAEFACVKFKENVRVAQQAVVSLKAKQASQAELQMAEDQLRQAEKMYHEQRNTTKVMLAVLGLSSPE